MHPTKRGGIYCRISLKDPNIPKVEVQEAIGRELAESNGIEVVEVYKDDGISASHFSKKDRPDWIRMLDDIKDGRIDVLLAQAEDRFSREPLEKAVLDDLCAARGVVYLTHADGTTDPSQASGRLGSGIKALVARYTVDTASEKHRVSNAAAARRGEPARGGDRPFGWQADKLTINLPEADCIGRAFLDLISGDRTLSKIRTDLNNAGVLTSRGGLWDITKVEAMLRRPRNAGIVTYKGERLYDQHGKPIAAQWEPIVSEDMYAAAMAMLDSPKRRATKVYEPKYLCSSLVFCGACGSPLRSTSNARAQTYRCATHDGVQSEKVNGTHVSINVGALDKAVTEAVVSAVLFSPADALPDPDTKALQALHVDLGNVRKAESNVMSMLDDPDLDRAMFKTKLLDLREKAKEAEDAIADITRRNARAALLFDAQAELWSGGKVSIRDAAKAKAEIRDKFNALSLDQRRTLVRGLLTVTVNSGRGGKRVKIEHLIATSLNDEPA